MCAVCISGARVCCKSFRYHSTRYFCHEELVTLYTVSAKERSVTDLLQNDFLLFNKLTCIRPPCSSGGIHPYVRSDSNSPLLSFKTSSTALKQEPPGFVSHVPFTKLSGQWPSQ